MFPFLDYFILSIEMVFVAFFFTFRFTHLLMKFHIRAVLIMVFISVCFDNSSITPHYWVIFSFFFYQHQSCPLISFFLLLIACFEEAIQTHCLCSSVAFVMWCFIPLDWDCFFCNGNHAFLKIITLRLMICSEKKQKS